MAENFSIQFFSERAKVCNDQFRIDPCRFIACPIPAVRVKEINIVLIINLLRNRIVKSISVIFLFEVEDRYIHTYLHICIILIFFYYKMFNNSRVK